MVFRFQGTINEDVNLGPVVQDIQAHAHLFASVNFDLGDLERMNSCGVREWLLMVEHTKNHANKFQFRELSFMALEQASMISSFLGLPHTPVSMVRIPHVCNSCKHLMDAAVPASGIRVTADTIELPPQKCPKCKGAMVPDLDLEQYRTVFEQHLK